MVGAIPPKCLCSRHCAYTRQELLEKFRGERQFCRRISVFIRTSIHAENEFLRQQCWQKFSLPTQDTRDIIEAAMRSLDRIWLEYRRYMKANIMLDDFTPYGVS
jgi:DNA polymerase V